jgi:hypothetical protein
MSDACLTLLKRLKDCTNRLDSAISQMNALAGAGRSDEFRAVSLDVESLRMECEVIRGEVERHKAEHMLPSTNN